jgi:hypothetical protein
MFAQVLLTFWLQVGPERAHRGKENTIHSRRLSAETGRPGRWFHPMRDLAGKAQGATIFCN